MIFGLCFEAHNTGGKVWAVKAPLGQIDDDQDWEFYSHVVCSAQIATIYRGQDSAQPKAYFVGHGSIVRIGDVCFISPER